MATAFEAVLVGGDGEHLAAVASAVEEEVRRLESLLSRFDPASDITRLNRAPAGRHVRLDPEVWALFAACETHRVATGGYFDVTAGGPVRRGQRLGLDSATSTVWRTYPEVRVDLGGVGKGYALDRAAALLRQFHITAAVLNAGTSSVLALGGPWPVGVRDPGGDADAPPIGRIKLADCGFSCSAARHPGQATSDIVNPLTRRPLAGRAACVVVAPDATAAEVFSTALLAMGRGPAARYLEGKRPPGVRAAWVEPDPGPARLDWLTEPP